MRFHYRDVSGTAGSLRWRGRLRLSTPLGIPKFISVALCTAQTITPSIVAYTTRVIKCVVVVFAACNTPLGRTVSVAALIRERRKDHKSQTVQASIVPTPNAIHSLIRTSYTVTNKVHTYHVSLYSWRCECCRKCLAWG